MISRVSRRPHAASYRIAKGERELANEYRCATSALENGLAGGICRQIQVIQPPAQWSLSVVTPRSHSWDETADLNERSEWTDGQPPPHSWNTTIAA